MRSIRTNTAFVYVPKLWLFPHTHRSSKFPNDTHWFLPMPPTSQSLDMNPTTLSRSHSDSTNPTTVPSPCNHSTYEQQTNRLIVESLLVSSVILSDVWCMSNDPFLSLSYFLGAMMGTAYLMGLGKYVQTIGRNRREYNVMGNTRFAYIGMLCVVVGTFHSHNLPYIPSIVGFFTYQLVFVLQSLTAKNDK